MTSHFGLHHLARIQPGERVLVQSAAGGVGLAAVQICRNAGAEVFATAGTPEKRAFLASLGIAHVMDSRTLDFADKVLELTVGEGVDVVLNSLAGRALAKGLSILRPFGRFVELGKRDLLANAQLDLAPFQRHLSFFAVDLDRMRKERPDQSAALAREVLAKFETGELRPIPRSDFRLSDAVSAFRLMAQGRHIGKIVLTMKADEYRARPTRAQSLCSPNATYLVTGGLGGFGLATAQWLVEQGARHIVLAGRSASPRPGNQSALDALLGSGANVTVQSVDVSVESEVALLLEHISRALPPLRGVFHTAMVLDDRKVRDLTPEDWEQVLAPKVSGAWHLHRLTSRLDYFVLFSSATAVLGNAGQANYAAANGFLDALAHHRRARGLPALSVGWGLLGDVGIAVDRPDLLKHFERIGFDASSAAELLSVLERLLKDGAGYAMPFRMAWRKLGGYSGALRSRYAEVLEATATAEAQSGGRGAGHHQDPAGGESRETLKARLLERAATVLGTTPSKIDVDAPLTSLGLDSLMAMELELGIKRQLGLQVNSVRLLQGLSIRALVEALVEPAADVQPVASRPRSVAARTRLPLAPGQRRLWFLQQLNPSSVAYNMPLVIRLTGALDTAAFEAAINEVVRRQEALRATFSTNDGEPEQWISPERVMTVTRTDLDAHPAAGDVLNRLIHEEARQAFDLSTGPLFSCHLVRMSAEEHVLLATAHHLIVDAWSAGIITRQALHHYRALAAGRTPAVTMLPLSYSEFVLRQIERTAERETAQLAYWKEQLRDVPTLRLPADYRSLTPGRQTSTRFDFGLPAQLQRSLEDLARQESATLFAVLLSAFAVLLARYSGQEDFCVGTPVASRFDDESRELVGCFVNTLAVRVRTTPAMTFRELLRQTMQTVTAAAANQDVTWERVVEHLNPVRDAGRLPIFNTLFVHHSFSMASAQLPGLRIESSLSSPGASPFEVVMVMDTSRGQGSIEYSAAFDAATIEAMARHFLKTLDEVADDAGRLVVELPGGGDIHRRDSGSTQAGRQSARGVHEWFEEQARRVPDRPAVIAGDERLDYRQLNEAAEKAAAVLRSSGVTAGSLVAIALERSASAVVAILATLKAGGAFVPLDVHAPAGRLRALLEETHVVVALTKQRLAARLAGMCPTVTLDVDAPVLAEEQLRGAAESNVGSGELAYVMYTSGSTGRPKGVMVEHGSICNQVAWRQAAFPLDAGEAVLHSTSLSFDPSVWEILGPLSAGATIVIGPDKPHDGARLNRLIREHGVTTLQAVPSLLRSWLDQGAFEGVVTIRRVFCGGEPLDALLAGRFLREVNAELINLYGCTETAIDASYRRCERRESRALVAIGRPIAETRLYVLDDRLRPVPDGVPGELCVSGSGVARGYLNDPDLTNRKFVPNPFVDEHRIFRTGDVARRLPGGDIELLGRLDRQVKVRGFRIEPAEVEVALRRHPDVRDVAVGPVHTSNADTSLAAWMVAGRVVRPGPAEMRAFLAGLLPELMVPAHYMWVDDLPRLSSGKIDARRLPVPAVSAARTSPRTAMEHALVQLWEEVLGATCVGVSDNFFELGGHSLLAVSLASRMTALLGREVRCQELFENPTIEGLSGTAGSTPNAPAAAEGKRLLAD